MTNGEAMEGYATVNHPSNYRNPLYVLTDDDYRAVGAVELDTERDRYIGRDTAGRVLFDRKTRPEDAAKRLGVRLVSSSWLGVTNGRPCDREEVR